MCESVQLLWQLILRVSLCSQVFSALTLKYICVTHHRNTTKKQIRRCQGSFPISRLTTRYAAATHLVQREEHVVGIVAVGGVR